MSQLIFRAWYNEQTNTTFGHDDVIAAFDGTAAETLGLAINFFNERKRIHNERIVTGDIPDAPDVIVDLAKQYLATPLAERNTYTIIQTTNGFDIQPNDDDRYSLIN